MLWIGCQLSSAGGFTKMGREALRIGANTFQCFVRNPRGTRSKAVDEKDYAAFRALLRENGFGPFLVHAPYTLNPCSSDPHMRDLAREMFAEDLRRMEYFPGNLYNFHPGSHTGQGVEVAVGQIAEMLNAVLAPEQGTTVLLETMSGKGSEVGSRFEELAEILARVELADQIGVCMDACHLSDAGYDIAEGLDDTLERFDKIVGLRRLRAFHINDSLNPRGSRKDRHAVVGEGTLGLATLIRILTHPALRHLPFVLETPTDNNGHAREIRVLREAAGE